MSGKTEESLIEAMQKFIAFLLKTLVDSVNQEILAKMQIFNNLLTEQNLPISEKSRILLEFTRTLDPCLPRQRTNSSVSTVSLPNNPLQGSQTNVSSSQHSHETFTNEFEKESFFSKPFILSEGKPQNPSELFIKVSSVLKEKSIPQEKKEPNNVDFLSQMLNEVSITREEFASHDLLIFPAPVKPNIQISTPFQIKSTLNKPSNFHNTTTNNKTNCSFTLPSHNLSNIEQTTATYYNMNAVPMSQNRTPEKTPQTVLVKKLLPGNSFIRKIPNVEKIRQPHTRQFSVHFKYGNRDGLSPYHLASPINTNIKVVKYS